MQLLAYYPVQYRDLEESALQIGDSDIEKSAYPRASSFWMNHCTSPPFGQRPRSRATAAAGRLVIGGVGRCWPAISRGFPRLPFEPGW